MKKGFTLIELLAVIVILAIIDVIATPIITGIIEDSKKVAFARSVEGIVKGTELDVSLKLDDDGYTYEITDGEIPKLDSNVSISNTKGYNGIIKYDSASNVSYAIYNDTWCIIKTDGESTVTEYNGECSLPVVEITFLMYNDGDVVYYDVLQGKTCTASEYHEDNSKTGYNGVTTTTDNQTSCLKFYAFNDDEGDSTVDLILDHNTTAKIVWNSSNSTVPSETFLTQLKTDTDEWVGTATPKNYTVSQTDAGNYTIDYSSYKARLITANEVAEITDNTIFDESITSYGNWFYFDTNSQTSSTIHSYDWLYDRTNTSCTNYGCLSNSDVGTYGYWTSTFVSSSFGYAWNVNYNGYLYFDSVGNNNYGVRPVIEVYKSNL